MKRFLEVLPLCNFNTEEKGLTSIDASRFISNTLKQTFISDKLSSVIVQRPVKLINYSLEK